MYSTYISRNALFLSVFAIAACTHDSTTTQEASTESGSPETAFPSGTPLDHPPIRSQPVKPKFPCRAIDAANKPILLPSPTSPIFTASPFGPTQGDAGTNFLARDMQIPEGDWIDLPATAKFTAKSPRTLRETTYEGVGFVRPCVDHDEEAWMIGGNFSAVSPGNESPGAEEWVVTTLGVVRYTSASLFVRTDKKSIDVKVTGGNASILVPSFVRLKDGSDAGSLLDAGVSDWIREDQGFSGTLSSTVSDEKMAPAAISACASAAAATKAIALQLEAPDAAIGVLGGQHTESRRLARGLCSVARVLVAKIPDDKPNAPPSKMKLQAAIDAAEKDWRTLP
ncbi:MAG: hypothetical protein ABI183_14760 [Polyangiaceae bacterium]